MKFLAAILLPIAFAASLRAADVRPTPQERAVLQMIAEGRQNKEIATVLSVSEKTVEHHRQHVMQKLALRDVASLTRYAIRHGMLAA